MHTFKYVSIIADVLMDFYFFLWKLGNFQKSHTSSKLKLNTIIDPPPEGF